MHDPTELHLSPVFVSRFQLIGSLSCLLYISSCYIYFSPLFGNKQNFPSGSLEFLLGLWTMISLCEGCSYDYFEYISFTLTPPNKPWIIFLCMNFYSWQVVPAFVRQTFQIYSDIDSGTAKTFSILTKSKVSSFKIQGYCTLGRNTFSIIKILCIICIIRLS